MQKNAITPLFVVLAFIFSVCEAQTESLSVVADRQAQDKTIEQVVGFAQCRHHFPGVLPRISEVKDKKAKDLCYDAFAILYSGLTKTPVFVVERLTAAQLQEAIDEKRTNRFFADARLPFRERAMLEDYKDSGFDRGHMAPAADMPTAQAMAQSFTLANCVPQKRVNNRRTWAGIEKATRRYVMRSKGPVYVFTGPVYAKAPPRTIGKNQVWIPTYLFKLVYDQTERRAWAYWIENTDEARASKPIGYKEFVKRTGMELLPNINPAN